MNGRGLAVGSGCIEVALWPRCTLSQGLVPRVLLAWWQFSSRRRHTDVGVAAARCSASARHDRHSRSGWTAAITPS